MYFFFNDTATTEIYTLSLHDALPICVDLRVAVPLLDRVVLHVAVAAEDLDRLVGDLHGDLAGLQLRHRALGLLRSEEHTSELQSRQYLVCRLLLEKKKKYLSNNRLLY